MEGTTTSDRPRPSPKRRERQQHRHRDDDGKEEREQQQHSRHRPKTVERTAEKKHRHRSRSRSKSPRARKHQKTDHHGDGHGDDHGDGHRDRRHHHHPSHRHDHQRRRSRSVDGGTDGSRHRTAVAAVATLPHGARQLAAGADYSVFEPLFAHYLDQEKHMRLADLQDAKKEREIQGRWRRFVDKWNGRGLADGWYEPQMFLRAVRARDSGSGSGGPTAEERTRERVEARVEKRDGSMEDEDDDEGDEDDDDDGDNDSDDYGPALPPPPPPPLAGEAQSTSTRSGNSRRHPEARAPGPAVPSRADLEERRELDDEARDADRQALRLARRADRAEQRERLDELVPRAAAGTRERQLEKKRALNDKLRGFRDRSPGGGGGEVDDAELMGDGKGGTGENGEDYRRTVAAMQSRRTFWQARREEEQQARDAELNERRAQYQAREEETMGLLRELARQRFG